MRHIPPRLGALISKHHVLSGPSSERSVGKNRKHCTRERYQRAFPCIDTNGRIGAPLNAAENPYCFLQSIDSTLHSCHLVRFYGKWQHRAQSERIGTCQLSRAVPLYIFFFHFRRQGVCCCIEVSPFFVGGRRLSAFLSPNGYSRHSLQCAPPILCS